MQACALDKHPFVRTLTHEQMDLLMPCARDASFAPGSFMFREGQSAETLYLVCAGIIALEQHVPGRGTVRVESLGAGDVVGLSWLFPEQRWTLDARCVEPVQALALPADCVLRLIREDKALGVELLGQMVQALYQRLVRVRLQRLDIYRGEA